MVIKMNIDNYRLRNIIHLKRSLCAFSMANLFFFPPQTLLLGVVSGGWYRPGSRFAEPCDVRGSGRTNSNKDSMAASRILRMYLDGEINGRVGCGPPPDVSSFITHAIKNVWVILRQFTNYQGIDLPSIYSYRSSRSVALYGNNNSYSRKTVMYLMTSINFLPSL